MVLDRGQLHLETPWSEDSGSQRQGWDDPRAGAEAGYVGGEGGMETRGSNNHCLLPFNLFGDTNKTCWK